MLHACFTPIALCFVYTLWHFYAFSGTNLLKRCHSASSYFLLFLCFRKVTHEIFLELDETKPEVPIFPNTRRSPKQRRRRVRRWAHHRVAWVHPWPRHPVVWGPWVPSDIAPPPIKSLRRALNQLRFFQIKFHSAAAVVEEIWGTEVSVNRNGDFSCRGKES
jgi:hypothetical protein